MQSVFAEVTVNPYTPFLVTQDPSWNVELDRKANTTVLEDSAGLVSLNRRLAVIPVIQPLFNRLPTQASPNTAQCSLTADSNLRT